MPQNFLINKRFVLQSGTGINGVHLAYTATGTLNSAADNVVWIFHALTANSDPLEWWPGLVGKDNLIDPGHYYIICVNMPGSPYGSISPLSTNPEDDQPYYHRFPLFTTRDMIRAYQHLRAALGIRSIFMGLGGSMGGQQLLEWAIEEPLLFRYIVPIATNARHSPWGIAFNATQRMCIEQDPTWKNKDPAAGIEGMKVARAVALLSYRHYHSYGAYQQGFNTNVETADGHPLFRAETYQRYQGEKLARRFNAISYYFLSQSMDAHSVGREGVPVPDALQRIRAGTLIIGIKTDILFPVEEQEYLARHIPDARFTTIDSLYGHDGFLLEFKQISGLIKEFLAREL